MDVLGHCKGVIGRAVLVAVMAIGTTAGCYKPDIKDGGLGCGPQDQCPEEFRCENRGGTGKKCYRIGGGDGGAADRADGATIEGGGDRSDVADRLPDGPPGMCVGPFMMCTPVIRMGQTCDPVCQANCGCTERCGVSGQSSFCEPVPATATKKAGDTCLYPPDDCAPGLACLRDGCGNRCYRYCRSNSECGAGGLCTLDVADSMGMSTGYKICDVSNTMCNPVGPAAMSACTTPGFGCYVIWINDETGCDCAGKVPAGGVCNFERDCVPGFLCIGGTCKRVCNIGAAGACVGGAACAPIVPGSSTRYGTCP